MGHPDKPINMVIVLPEGAARSQIEDAAQTFAARLTYGLPGPEATPVSTAKATTTGSADTTAAPTESPTPTAVPRYTFTATVFDTNAEAITALCEQDEPAIGWVDAWGYLVVEAMDCASPRYIVKTGRGRRARTHTDDAQVTIIYNSVRWISTRGQPIETMSDLQGQPFCRLQGEYDDPLAWRIPALMLMTGGIDPIDVGVPGGLGSITEYEDLEEMVSEVYDAAGDCIGAVVPADWQDDVKDLEETLGDLSLQIGEFEASVVIPNPVMVYPNTIHQGIRNHVDQTIEDLLEDDAGARLLKLLFDADDLVDVDAEDFDEFRTFIEAAGIDPIALGQ